MSSVSVDAANVNVRVSVEADEKNHKMDNERRIQTAREEIAQAGLAVGALYLHYKVLSERKYPHLYQLTSVGIDEETLRPKVSLLNLNTGQVWYRFLDAFLGQVTVDIQAEEGVQLPRFQVVAAASGGAPTGPAAVLRNCR